jgi:hypothetical protein
LLLISSHTDCAASAVKALLAQLKPLLELVDILEDVQSWLIKTVDLSYDIHQTLLTFILFRF